MRLFGCALFGWYSSMLVGPVNKPAPVPPSKDYSTGATISPTKALAQRRSPYGIHLMLEKSGLRFSRKALRPSLASSVM